jgi:hypothetical protein
MNYGDIIKHKSIMFKKNNNQLNVPIKYKLVSSVAIMVNIQTLTNSEAEVDLHN